MRTATTSAAGSTASRVGRACGHEPFDGRRGDHAELLTRSRNGEPGALRDLIVCCTPVVERAARRRCANPADAEDVIQEVWITLMNSLDSIRSPERLLGWLHRVTLNAATEHGRKTGKAVPLAIVPESVDFDDDSGPMRRLARQTTNDSVNGALKRLRETDRRLMEMLMDTDRPDYASISRRTERPLGSIGPTRQRILSRLRRDPAIVRLAASF